MSKSSIVQQVERQIALTQAMTDRLKKQARVVANRQALQNERERRSRVIANIRSERAIRERITLALQTISALREIGRTDEVRSLIEMRSRPIQFFGDKISVCPGYDMADVTWHYWAFIIVTSDRVVIDCDEAYLEFPYTGEDVLLDRTKLRRIATPSPLDWEDIEREARQSQTAYLTPEVLFEILVECADQGKFEQRFVRAIS